MTVETARVAVLRDYPLRLWAEQNEHLDGLLREFQLMLLGEQDPELHAAPVRLVQLAELVQGRFGGLLKTVDAERQRALDAGLDRIDSRLPLAEGLPGMLDQVHDALVETDAFCRQRDLLSLPRSPLLVRFATWAGEELRTQYDGGPPTPWPGPF